MLGVLRPTVWSLFYGMPYPYCGELIEEQQPVIRKTYKKHTPEDRERIIAAAGNGECWVALSKVLRIPRNTAKDWVNSNLERRGPCPKAVTGRVW